jgi:DNA-binding NarL/FixJ family response regulator
VDEVRVLIVDDQELFRGAMAAVVEETHGLTVVGSAASGEDSLIAVATLRPDLVLMDVNMPGMDGIEATRALTSRPDAPIVMLLSTYDADQFDLADCGASCYLAKGALAPESLSAAWRAAVSESRR